MLSVLNAAYWEREFAVTDGDVERTHRYLCKCREPQEATRLLERIIAHKLQRGVPRLDPAQRAKSEASAASFLERATVYHPTLSYSEKQQLFVAVKRPPDKWRIGKGTVTAVEQSKASHYRSIISVFVDEIGETWRFIAELDPKHPWNKQFKSPLPGTSQLLEQIMEVYGSILLPHLLGRLTQDSRFVNWGDLWWAGAVVPSVEDSVLREAQRLLLKSTQALTLDDLLQALLPGQKAVGNAERFALYQALKARPHRFSNVGTELQPRYRPLLPNLPQEIEKLRQVILARKTPIALNVEVADLFPNHADRPESQVAIMSIVRDHLDQRFIQVAPNLWF
ncbi:MAG: hypothetical protein E3J21_00830, partial [Anaerolineales bacterium]